MPMIDRPEYWPSAICLEKLWNSAFCPRSVWSIVLFLGHFNNCLREWKLLCLCLLTVAQNCFFGDRILTTPGIRYEHLALKLRSTYLDASGLGWRGFAFYLMAKHLGKLVRGREWQDLYIPQVKSHTVCVAVIRWGPSREKGESQNCQQEHRDHHVRW